MYHGYYSLLSARCNPGGASDFNMAYQKQLCVFSKHFHHKILAYIMVHVVTSTIIASYSSMI